MMSLGYLGTRSDLWSLCYYDGEYHVVRSKPKSNQSIASLYTIEKRFRYGRYKATVKAYCTTGVPERIFPFGFENHHGFPEEGIITFLLRHGGHYAMSSFEGKTYETKIPEQDWSEETVLEVDWIEGEVTFYVNGEETVTHRTDMQEGSWFIETIGYDLPCEIYAYQKEFEVI
ncbi:unnamed protein product [marine sediment metagenome]|uniref:Uncharacterized protein n=1 Tax=marine sediment metagenome TaxID=412755 RepID=X0XH13_9ZZZZ